MRILFIGDVDGQAGRRKVVTVLPGLVSQYHTDVIIANCENLTHGLGARESHIREMLEAGVNYFTSGNHIWDIKEIIPFLDQKDSPVLRPANYPPGVAGAGVRLFTLPRGQKLLLINLLGQLFMSQSFENPFHMIDRILAEFGSAQPDAVIIDFHAEATSEKRAFGFYVDGRVSAVIGTHTHIPTADAQVLPKGTAYISDVGMVGAHDSVLGVNKELAINYFRTQIPVHWEAAEGEGEFSAVFIETDDKTHLAKSIELVQR